MAAKKMVAENPCAGLISSILRKMTSAHIWADDEIESTKAYLETLPAEQVKHFASSIDDVVGVDGIDNF